MICTRDVSCITRRILLSHRLRHVYTTKRPMSTFNSKKKVLQRNRAAGLDNHHQYDYLKNGVAEILTERISDISRDFPSIVDLGAGKGHVASHVNTYITQHVTECDTAEACLNLPRLEIQELKTDQILLDSEDTLPFEDNSKELIISNLWLHWVNDLPKLFKDVERVLIPDGVFLGAMFATDTVYQLRVSLQQAELERTGGIASHISPFVTPQDIGSLLNSANFCMITLDCDEMTVTYPDLYYLLRDLQGMGESNCLLSQPTLRRDVLTGAAAIYHDLYASSEDSTLPLTFNILYFIAWKRSTVQGVPRPRGSQTASIADLDKIINSKPGGTGSKS